jgi:pre-rRNA-processing protein IPI3
MHIHETILCSTAPPTDASAKSLGAGTFSLFDISTGSSIASFKQTNAASRCAQVLPTVGDVGGLLFAAQSDKSVLNVYNFQKVGM